MTITKWVSESDPLILRRVGKAGEELAELAKVCSRITIQGFAGIDPKTGISNRQSLEEEIADVMAQCECMIKTLELDAAAISARTISKIVLMDKWDAMFQPDYNDIFEREDIPS